MLTPCSPVAVNVFGHSDAEWAAVLARQSERLAHTSNLYYTEEQAKLAQKLVTLTPWSSKVFFANTGTEANEAAIKFARKRGVAIAPNKTRVIAFKKGFHGRTMGSLSVTEKPAYRRQYGAMVDFGPEEVTRAVCVLCVCFFCPDEARRNASSP